MNEKFAELLEIMFGDGCLSKYSNCYIVYISGHKADDLDYHSTTICGLFKDVFNKKTHVNIRNDEQTLITRFSDKEIFAKISSYMPIGKKYDKLKVPSEILNDRKYFFAFMRGFVDTDGTIIFSKQHKNHPYYPRIEIASISKSLLCTLLSELEKYGFYGSVSRKTEKSCRLEMPGQKNLRKWFELIGFNNSKNIRKIKSHLRGLETPLDRLELSTLRLL